MVLQAGTELEAAPLLVDQGAADAGAHLSGHRRRTGLVASALSVALLGAVGVAMRGHTASSTSANDVVELAASREDVAAKPVEPFAVVPLVWTVVMKTDGVTGHLPNATVNKYVEALNKHFSGKGNDEHHQAPDVQAILKGSSCYEKCNVALCYKGGAATDLATKEKVSRECHCQDDYCKDWGFKYADEKGSPLSGPNVDTGLSFKLDSVRYIMHDEYHLQCCCTYAGFKYDIKQNEMFDVIISKDRVRDVANIIVCDMTTLGGGTAGQSMISGSPSCNGGPGIMLDHGVAKHVEYGIHTLVHEFGHHFGLYHTFNEECNGNFGACTVEEVCKPDVNKGDRIPDTPVHRKQEACNDADSCPDSPGKDPLDNYMSYSGCAQRRFTPEQVQKMQSIVTKYYPGMLVSENKPEAEDLPCDPGFPSGEVPAGYAPPTPAPPSGGASDASGTNPQSPPSCQLEVGQCDQHDTTGCYCVDARHCCANHGCGGSVGAMQCLPCSWKSFADVAYTSDSCPDQ